MLPGQTEVRPEKILAPQTFNVNDLFLDCARLSDHVCALLFERLISALQEEWLREEMGPPWSKGRRVTRLVCPRCRHHGFIRRGWRIRTIGTSRGMVRIRLAQISCRKCRRVFRPYTPRLGLPSTRRFLPRSKRR